MNICLYGAASDKIPETYKTQTEQLCEKLAQNGHTLVFGGGSTGLMGAAARGFTKGNGNIIGVVPEFMNEFEPVYDKCTETIKTETMGERKAIMEKLADVFIVAPGGVGTYDELFQIITLRELNRKEAPVILFNINGFYNVLMCAVREGNRQGFIKDKTVDLFLVCNSIEEVMETLRDNC